MCIIIYTIQGWKVNSGCLSPVLHPRDYLSKHLHNHIGEQSNKQHRVWPGQAEIKFNPSSENRVPTASPSLCEQVSLSKKHPRNHHGLNGFNFALFSGIQSYNYLTSCQQCPLTQGYHTGWDNNDNDGCSGHILTLKVELCLVSQWFIERKGKGLAVFELLMN